MNEMIEGKHYSEYVETITEFLKSGERQKALELLNKIIDLLENIASKSGQGVAPWYYEKLAAVYKKDRNKDAEINALLRFLSQPKARGSKPRKIYEKYIKLNAAKDESRLQDKIYECYKNEISKSNLKVVKFKCSSCNKIGEYLIPVDENGAQMKLFGACCPYCCESLLINV